MDYDYIVVGAGSAGCVLAARLSEDPSTRVLLLESGGKDSNPWIHIPVGYFKTMHDPKTDWRYRTEPEPSLNGRSLDWPRREGSRRIELDQRAALRSRTAAGLRPLAPSSGTRAGCSTTCCRTSSSEDQERGASEWHGAGGPLAVSDMRVQRDVCDAFIAEA